MADNESDAFRGLNKIANSIATTCAAGGTDAAGGHVECLTEAVMGVTGALMEIASAMLFRAEAIEMNRTNGD